MESSGRPRRRQMPTLPTRPPKQFYAYASSNAISNLMVRSAERRASRTMKPPDTLPSFETALRASFGISAIALIPKMRTLQLRVVDRLVAIERARDRRQRIFKPCRTIEQHDAIVFRHAAVGKALLVGSIRRRPFRTQQQAFFARHFVERSRNLLIRHRDRKSLALADH